MEHYLSVETISALAPCFGGVDNDDPSVRDDGFFDSYYKVFLGGSLSDYRVLETLKEERMISRHREPAERSIIIKCIREYPDGYAASEWAKDHHPLLRRSLWMKEEIINQGKEVVESVLRREMLRLVERETSNEER